MSGGVKVSVRRGGLDPGLPLPSDDAAIDLLGVALFGRLGAAVARGRAGPAALGFFEDGVQQVDLGPAIERGAAVVQQLLAATAGQPGCLCVAQLAVLHARRPGRQYQAFATVLLELPDNRWWMVWAAGSAWPGGPGCGCSSRPPAPKRGSTSCIERGGCRALTRRARPGRPARLARRVARLPGPSSPEPA